MKTKIKITLLGAACGCLAAHSPALAGPQAITPGAVWRDTAGRTIQAHGGGMIQVGRTFYWFGEDHDGGGRDQSFRNVACYASQDLSHWTFRGNALARQPGGDLGPARVVERPKVLYNGRTKTYVMYMHIDSRSYGEAKVGVAVSRRVEGPYAYRGSFRPLGHQSRDMTLFQDSDGTGYLIFEDRQSGVRIERLSPDYLGVRDEVALIPRAYEAPAAVRIGQTYFLLGSHLSGWSANPNQYATAPALAGPWSDFRDVAPPATNTYNSQTAFILPVRGRRTTSYLYGGDRWEQNDLGDSRYVWLPLTVGGHSLSLPSDAPWAIDAATGTVSAPPP